MGDNNEDDGAGEAVVPASQKSSFMSFVKTLATTTSDLHTLSCPAFLLEGTSILELFRSQATTPEVFLKIASVQDPAERMLSVVAWWLVNQWHSYGTPFAGGRAVKKPYNPILGEQYFCHWETAEGKVELVSEQVSHHPPISACFIKNEEKQIFLNATIFSRTRFRGTGIKVENYGHCVVRLPKLNDEYRLSYPEAYLRGIMTGRLFVELLGTTEITSASGYSARIEFIGKPWFSGEYHCVKGEVFKTSEGSRSPIYTFSGRWAGKVEALHVASKTRTTIADIEHCRIAPVIHTPLENQTELESQKVWQATTAAIKAEDFSAAMKEKTTVEERQRALRKEREASGAEWKPKYFSVANSASDVMDEFDRRKGEDKHAVYFAYNEMPQLPGK